MRAPPLPPKPSPTHPHRFRFLLTAAPLSRSTADLYNELTPPSVDPGYLRNASAAVYSAISNGAAAAEMMRAAEVSTVARLKQCFEDLNCVGRLGLEEAGDPSNVLGPRRGGLPN